VDSLGAASNGTTTDGHNLIAALANHDVVVCLNNTQFSALFSTADKTAFLAWANQPGHGVVASHGATDDNDSWPDKITFFGGKFTEHTSGNAALLNDTIAANMNDEGYKAINLGIPKTQTVNDEWYSYQSNPRNLPGIHILSTLNEATYNPSAKMGDHPISWYRAPAGGGRLYYTGAGHDWTYFRDTYWLRRQYYNGILWASGWTAATKVVVNPEVQNVNAANVATSNGSISVSVMREGAHTVEIVGLNGKRVSLEHGVGSKTYTFTSLKPNAVYAVLVSTPREKIRQLITTR
jgi:hypothetical protein